MNDHRRKTERIRPSAPGGTAARPVSGELPPVWYSAFRDVIREKIGFVLPQVPAPSLRSFVEGRMRLRNDSRSDAYVAALRAAPMGDPELASLINTITIKKTHFFRDINQFEAVRVIMRRLATTRRQPVHIWCAGCSTGEEPISLAMLADTDHLTLELLASDVNTDALATARRGQYTDLTLGEITHEFRQRYLQPLDRGWRVSAPVQKVPQFVHHNLMSRDYPRPSVGMWDIVFCRNVLIYFDEPTVEAVVARFHRVLAPDGLLIVGAGESLHGKKTDYELVPIGRSFAYRPTHIGSHTRPSGRHAAVSLPPALASGEIEVPDGLMVPEDYDTGTYVIPPDGISGMMERERMAGSASRRDRQTPDRPAAGTMIDLDMFVADFNRGGTARQTAIDRLKKRLVSRTGSMEELLTLGNAMLEVGDTEGALDLYNRAQNLDPLSPEVHFLVGLVHKKMGARWPAIQAFRRALFLEPGFWPAAFYLAVMYQSEGMSAEALREYANTLRILESSSRPPRFVSRLARNEFQSRLADEVMTVCRARLAGGGANGRG